MHQAVNAQFVPCLQSCVAWAVTVKLFELGQATRCRSLS